MGSLVYPIKSFGFFARRITHDSRKLFFFRWKYDTFKNPSDAYDREAFKVAVLPECKSNPFLLTKVSSPDECFEYILLAL